MPILDDTFHGVLVLAAYGDVLQDKVRLKEYTERAIKGGARRIVLDVSRLDVPADPLDPFDSCNPWQADLVSATRLAQTRGATLAWVIRGFPTLDSHSREVLLESLFDVKGVEAYGTREDAVNALKESH